MSRFRDLFEIVSAYGLIVAVIWAPMPAQRILFWIAFAWIILITVLRRESVSHIGMGLRTFPRAVWIILAALALSGIAMLIAARIGTLHPLFGRRVPLALRIGGYILWSFLQEYILQAYVLLRLLRLLPSRKAAIAITAAMFAIAHLPNPVLTWLTLIWGAIACPLYLRYRNLYVLGIAHAILGLSVAITVPDSIHHHMRVGIGYVTYSKSTIQSPQ
jgi:membrane protease YdiL (CAAX protease family)